MEKFIVSPMETRLIGKKAINVFACDEDNVDQETIQSFGDEWKSFSKFSDHEIKVAGDQYFDIVPANIYSGKYVLDVGCGTGRWSKYISQMAGELEAIDPSEAVISAAALLQDNENVRVSQASAGNIPFPDDTFDFVLSLGVLHHIPDTRGAMQKCIDKVKPGGYFLVYLYYSLDNRGILFRSLFCLSNFVRKIISLLPFKFKKLICDLIAFTIYLPVIFMSRILKILGFGKWLKYVPLSYYVGKSLNIIRNDALDRFGTPLEQRFSRNEIHKMLVDCGLTEIVFSEKEPYWHAIGKKIDP